MSSGAGWFLRYELDLPHADGLNGEDTVVDAKAFLEVDGVLADLVPDQEDDLLLLQQGAQIQALKMGAEGPPVGVVKINMVFPADVFAFAHIVHQILQLILGIDVGGEDGGVQIFEEIAGDYGSFKIYIIAKTPLFRVEGRIAVVVVRKKVNGKLLKGEKILAE